MDWDKHKYQYSEKQKAEIMKMRGERLATCGFFNPKLDPNHWFSEGNTERKDRRHKRNEFETNRRAGQNEVCRDEKI